MGHHRQVISLLAKGDTLIWHLELPHGGCPIESTSATRASIVFHCLREGVPFFGPERFFSDKPTETPGSDALSRQRQRAIHP